MSSGHATEGVGPSNESRLSGGAQKKNSFHNPRAVRSRRLLGGSLACRVLPEAPLSLEVSNQCSVMRESLLRNVKQRLDPICFNPRPT